MKGKLRPLQNTGLTAVTPNGPNGAIVAPHAGMENKSENEPALTRFMTGMF